MKEGRSPDHWLVAAVNSELGEHWNARPTREGLRDPVLQT